MSCGHGRCDNCLRPCVADKEGFWQETHRKTQAELQRVSDQLLLLQSDAGANIDRLTAQVASEKKRADATDDMRAVLVYARDSLAHLARFHGHDLTLLREAIVSLLGEPAPAVGSTFARVLEIARATIVPR